MAPWKLRALVAGGAALAVAALAGALVGPALRDDLALDRAVRAVALEWRDFGKERAWERLQFELDHRGVGLQVADDDCELRAEGERRVVHCAWETEIHLAAWSQTLSFESRAVITPGGDLR